MPAKSQKEATEQLKQQAKVFEENWQNPMRKPFLEKVVLNIGAGTGGEELERAARVLEDITKRKALRTVASKSVKEWGLRQGVPIGVKITVRGDRAEKLLKRLLIVFNNRILKKCFDHRGNFSFGIDEHISIPGAEYDNEIGIWGLNVSCRIVRKGMRVKVRRKRRNKICSSHYVSRDEAQYFMRKFFNSKIVDQLEIEYI